MMKSPPFHDRRDAGKHLAKKLSHLSESKGVIVLALPRGGVPVGFEIAKKLHVPFDLMLVRKLGVPGEEELAFGAIALPDIRVLNRDIVENISITKEKIDFIANKEREELLSRNQLYRHNRPLPILKDNIVILVDDGVATGADMRAAIDAVLLQKPCRIIIAIPVAPKETIESFKASNIDVFCLHTPTPFFNVGQAYADFSQTSDEEVLSLLKGAER